mmetsp:Transcript_3056/g.7205  ORF Transcript_3056/g.7205 Transcript_3056/m.7205 type:complete len:773 (+) Transcript_3056:153-2471(+)
MMRIKRSEGTTATLVLGLLLWFGNAAIAEAFTTGKEDGSIPTFSFGELGRLYESEHRAADFRNALSTNGLLAIQLDDDEETDFFGYTNDRRTAFEGLCSCVDHPEFLKLDQTQQITLMDSSTARTSVATATVGLEHPLPLPEGMENTCGESVFDAMEGLREVISSVSKAFVSALDATLDNDNSGKSPQTTLLRDEFGRSYKSVSDIVQSANHLEHFHVYTNNQTDNFSAPTNSEMSTAWDWHTDAGLFLVFVPAWDCNGDENNVDESFYYRDTDGTTVRAKFDGGNTAIVMLGQGAQDWLQLPEQAMNQPLQNQKSLALKATTHSVRWSSGERRVVGDNLPKQRRAWYGMMNLVPETALIYGGKTLRDVKKSLSLHHQHKTDFNIPEVPSSGKSVALGCGSVLAPPHEEPSNGVVFELEEPQTTSRRRRHLMMQDGSICNNITNFFCWMTCMDVPEVEEAALYLEAGYSLYCADEAILRSTDELENAANACIDVHNMACKGLWERTDDEVASVKMNAVAIESGDLGDIEYPFCYGGTTMYMEGFQWIQSSTCVIVLFESWVLNTPFKYGLAVVGTIFLAIGLEKFIQQRRRAMARMEVGTKRLMTSAAFYGVQLMIGYVLMLIIMIYSGVLFLSVILGLVVGHILFNARDAIWPIHETQHLNKDITVENKNDETDGNNNVGVRHPRRSSSRKSFSNVSEAGEERALREGSTHCQEFESSEHEQEYYGSLENGNNQETESSAGNTNKMPTKRKTIDQAVSEGSTPCCQHGEAA